MAEQMLFADESDSTQSDQDGLDDAMVAGEDVFAEVERQPPVGDDARVEAVIDRAVATCLRPDDVVIEMIEDGVVAAELTADLRETIAALATALELEPEAVRAALAASARRSMGSYQGWRARLNVPQ